MKYKSLEELRAAFPDEPMDDLAEIAKETGLDTTSPQEEETGDENSETPAEETAEEEVETPEDEEEEADPKTKYALIQARKKEKDKRKAAEAELKAKTEEYERRIAELSARPQQQTYQAPAVEQAVQPSYYDILMDEADVLARKEAGIDRGITDDELSTMLRQDRFDNFGCAGPDLVIVVLAHACAPSPTLLLAATRADDDLAATHASTSLAR